MGFLFRAASAAKGEGKGGAHFSIQKGSLLRVSLNSRDFENRYRTSALRMVLGLNEFGWGWRGGGGKRYVDVMF